MSEAELDADAVAAVVGRITGRRVVRVERLAGSVANQDFLVSAGRPSSGAGDVILKASAVQDLVAEAWACERVRRAGVLAPEVLWLEPTPQSLPLPFLLMRRLPGGPVEAGADALVRAGERLAAVHEIRLEGFGALAVDGDEAHGTAADWAGHLARLTTGLDELVAGGVLTRGTVAEALETLDRSGDAVRFAGPGVLLHGDLKPAHVFATSDGEVALIDWGDVCAGDPRFDLTPLSMAGAEALAPVLSGYGLALTAELRRTLACYRLVRNLDALRFELRAGGDWFDTYREAVRAAVTELATTYR